MRSPSILAAVASAAGLLATAGPAVADALPGQVVVGYEGDATARQRAAARRDAGATAAQGVGPEAVQLLTVPGADDAVLAGLRESPGVAYAEPVFPTSVSAVPGDSGFGAQWPLANAGGDGGLFDADVDAEQAWDLVGSGSSSVLVGIADSGHDPRQPGLSGVTLRPDPSLAPGATDDQNGHGTAVTGIVLGNWGAGSVYAGLAPSSQLSVAKVIDASGMGTTAGLAAGLQYLGEAGARVVNVSVAGPYSEAVHQAIATHLGTLFVAAAGNAGIDVDDAPVYPCEDPSPNVLCVAATDDRDALAPFSNYGASGVDLAAPGQHVPGLGLGSSTGFFSGTSFAAPMVTGIAALAFAARPTATVGDVKDAILWNTDGAASLTGRTATGGRANAYHAISFLLGLPAHPRPAQATVAPGGAAGEGAPGTAGTHGSFSAAPAGKATVSVTASVTVSATARRAGAQRIAVRVRCVAARGCRQGLRLVAGSTTRTTRIALRVHASKTIMLDVRRAAAIRTVSLIAGTGALHQHLSVRVAR